MYVNEILTKAKVLNSAVPQIHNGRNHTVKSRSPFTANGSLLDSARFGRCDALSDEFPALGVFTRPELLCALGEELARIRIEANRLTEICGDIRNER